MPNICTLYIYINIRVNPFLLSVADRVSQLKYQTKRNIMFKLSRRLTPTFKGSSTFISRHPGRIKVLPMSPGTPATPGETGPQTMTDLNILKNTYNTSKNSNSKRTEVPPSLVFGSFSLLGRGGGAESQRCGK